MEKKFVNILRDPLTGNNLNLVVFTEKEDNIIDGLLIDTSLQNIYCISAGVPIMLESGIPSAFYQQYEREVGKQKELYPGIKIVVAHQSKDWSFSHEWDFFENESMGKTWHMTVEDRYVKFLFENQVTEEEVKSKLILDAGCGNGTHTENVSGHCASIVGLDFSESIFNAEKRRTSKNLLFVQGDLQKPPFAEETFDMIISNGVIHHTPSTYTTFLSVSKLSKMNGSLYLWLYSRQGNLGWRFKRRCFDIARMIVCRLPGNIQKMAVSVTTFLLFNIRKLLGYHDDFLDVKLDIYDSITPRWRHYHEPLEVRSWYLKNGYSQVLFTNWETWYGFGILGRRKPGKI